MRRVVLGVVLMVVVAGCSDARFLQRMPPAPEPLMVPASNLERYLDQYDAGRLTGDEVVELVRGEVVLARMTAIADSVVGVASSPSASRKDTRDEIPTRGAREGVVDE